MYVPFSVVCVLCGTITFLYIDQSIAKSNPSEEDVCHIAGIIDRNEVIRHLPVLLNGKQQLCGHRGRSGRPLRLLLSHYTMYRMYKFMHLLVIYLISLDPRLPSRLIPNVPLLDSNPLANASGLSMAVCSLCLLTKGGTE